MQAAQKIIKELQLRGMTKYKIAKATSSNWQSVHYWEKGVFNPNVEKMRKLLDLYDEVVRKEAQDA